ncbi:beta-ketoacyl synthase N-terminal-like domain-containing protein [Actinophytocola sp.]|uniref:beta-ketoacyl synthase N-terminal-like domain-containing protein n=1 Tax=Actinophytocola sp. TaxID=1872138 RepID=UPI003D6BC927
MTVITAWSAVSAYGVGAAALADGLREQRTVASTVDPEAWPVPGGKACVVPGFDARELLGAKGTRSMDRVSALAVLTAGQVARDAGDLGEDAGLVLGVNNGSAQSMLELTRDSLVKARPEFVKPAQFPNTLMNAAAAQCAIWHRLRGPNATVAAGRTSGLVALNHARRMQRSGRAEAVLCGAAEEFSTTRAWLEHHAAPNRPDGVLLGEGCAMLLVEPAARHGRTELAELLGLAFGVFRAPAEAGPALAGCVRRVIAAAGESPDRVWAHAAAHDPDLSDVDKPVDAVLGAPLRLPMTELVGDTHAASAAFGLAAVLALAVDEPRAGGRTALVTAADRDGTVGCALLRLADAAA